MFKKSLIITSALVALFSPVQTLAANFSASVLASGLQSPRGITLGPDGKLYIAEAGTGGNGVCIPSPGGDPNAQLCYGASGAIARLDVTTGNIDRPINNLPSLAQSSGAEATGIHDLYFNGSGNLFGVIGLGTTPDTRDNTLQVPTFGNLIAVNLSGIPSWSTVADLAAFEGTNDPNGDGVDSNPYSLVIQGDTTYATDAGGNSLLQIVNGNITDRATFPARLVSSPPFIPNLPPNIPMQAVPTGMAVGPDNNLYIGQLTGFPFPVGGANVYQFDGTNLTVFAGGFTNIIDVAFGPDGSLYVLDYATNLLLGNSQGSLWRVQPNQSPEKILEDGLLFPTGIAVGNDGTIYVANRGFVAGQGEILEIVPVPETTSLVALGLFGLLGLGFSRQKEN